MATSRKSNKRIESRIAKLHNASDLETNEFSCAVRSKKRKLYQSPESPNKSTVEDTNYISSDEDVHDGSWNWDSELKKLFQTVQTEAKKGRKLIKGRKQESLTGPLSENVQIAFESFQAVCSKIDHLRTVHYQKYADLILNMEKESELLSNQVKKMMTVFEETCNLYVDYKNNQKKRIEDLQNFNKLFFQSIATQNKQFKETGSKHFEHLKKSLDNLQKTIEKKSQTSEMFKKSLLQALW